MPPIVRFSAPKIKMDCVDDQGRVCVPLFYLYVSCLPDSRLVGMPLLQVNLDKIAPKFAWYVLPSSVWRVHVGIILYCCVAFSIFDEACNVMLDWLI